MCALSASASTPHAHNSESLLCVRAVPRAIAMGDDEAKTKKHTQQRHATELKTRHVRRRILHHTLNTRTRQCVALAALIPTLVHGRGIIKENPAYYCLDYEYTNSNTTHAPN